MYVRNFKVIFFNFIGYHQHHRRRHKNPNKNDEWPTITLEFVVVYLSDAPLYLERDYFYDAGPPRKHKIRLIDVSRGKFVGVFCFIGLNKDHINLRISQRNKERQFLS